MRSFASSFLAFFLVMTSGVRGFALIECDRNDTPGDAGILLGWPTPTEAGIGDLQIDDQGAPESGISGPDLTASWNAGLNSWASSSGTTLALPVPTDITATPADVTSLLSEDDRRLFTVIHSGTTNTGGLTGWEGIVGLPANVILGITLVRMDNDTRLITDGDVVLNDDVAGGATPFFLGAVQPTKMSLQSVIDHELGHFFGSAHTDMAGSLMNPTLAPGDAKPMAEDDRDIVRFLYPAAPFPNAPENNLDFVDCTTLVYREPGEILALGLGSPGGCQVSPGEAPAASALGLLWLAFLLAFLRRGGPPLTRFRE